MKFSKEIVLQRIVKKNRTNDFQYRKNAETFMYSFITQTRFSSLQGLVLRQQSNSVDGKVKDEKLSLKGFDKGHIRTL